MLKAIVTFHGIETGGRHTAPQSGYRPQLEVDEMHTSCLIESADGAIHFPLGVEHEVLLTLMFPKESGEHFVIGDNVRFYEGSRLVGTGKITGRLDGTVIE